MGVQSPTTKSEISHSQRNERHAPQVVMQALIVPSERSIAECDSAAGERLALGGAERRRVVEINAVKLEIPEYRMAAELLDEVFNRLGGEWIFS